jgi:thiol-disulfide isomerase/thioredoxin
MKMYICLLLIVFALSEELTKQIEINDINYLRSFLIEKSKVFIDVYSPTCPHCVEFAPVYYELAKTVMIY